MYFTVDVNCGCSFYSVFYEKKKFLYPILISQQLPEKDREAILALSFTQLQTKLQHGYLKAVDVLTAYQAKVKCGKLDR